MGSSPTPSEEPRRSNCQTAVRVPLFLINLVTWIAGGGLIGLGIWIVSTNNSYKHFAENQNIYIVYMTLSALLFTAGIFGACGVLAKNKVLLKMYFVIICVVFVALFGVCIFGMVQKNLIKQIIHKSWNKTTDETRIFFQEKFSCCGIDENAYEEHKSNIDKSCFVGNTTFERKQDCFSTLMEWFEDNQMTIALFSASVMLIMIVLMVSSCWFIHHLGKYNKRNRVVPLKINQSNGKQSRRQDDNNSQSNNEMATIEEPEENSYSTGRNKTGKKWAKNSSHY